MIFLETETLNLTVPSKSNINQWTTWINSSFVRETVPSTLFPTTTEMQWDWIETQLRSKKRILLQICDKTENKMLGIVSLSDINFQNKSAQIATISPIKKNKQMKFSVYEARKALVEYAYKELCLNKIYGSMIYPKNASFMVNNMCIGFEVEGVSHDAIWQDNQSFMQVNYFLTRSLYDKKVLWSKNVKELLIKEYRIHNRKKLDNIISILDV